MPVTSVVFRSKNRELKALLGLKMNECGCLGRIITKDLIEPLNTVIISSLD